MKTAFLLSAALAFLPLSAGEVSLKAGPERPKVDLVLCLDASNSMDGLIASAKLKLWAIVSEMAKARPAPELRVALLSYGNTGYDAARGWVRVDCRPQPLGESSLQSMPTTGLQLESSQSLVS